MSQQSTSISAPVQGNAEKPIDERLNIASPLEDHYANVIGAFKDDSMLDAMMVNIHERRREMDADDTIE